MDREERRDTSGKHREEDPQDFENIGHEVRERQSPSVGEEGTEEDRRQWKKIPVICTKEPNRSPRKPTSLIEGREGGTRDHS
jgi:hypothetical protein